MIVITELVADTFDKSIHVWCYEPMYSEYVNRVILYKQQIWTCKYTNKSRLTFEEALRCERKFLYRLIHDQFNRHILKPICELVRTMNVVLSTNMNLSVVAEDMFNRYTSQFLDGEEVMCQFTLNQPLYVVFCFFI